MIRLALKVPLHIVEARRHRLADYLRHHAYAPLQAVCGEFGVSEATARRALAALAAPEAMLLKLTIALVLALGAGLVLLSYLLWRRDDASGMGA